MPATIHDVVRLSGFSRATVTRSFAEPDLVKPATREIIYAAARQLNYTPNAIAQAMARKRTDNIGFILCEKQYPVILNSFYAPIVDAVLESCQEHDLSLIISSSDQMYLPNGDIYLKKQLDAAILAGDVQSDLVDCFLNQQIPVVLLNALSENEEMVSILPDHYGGARAAVDYLLKLGHQRIGLLQAEFSPFINRARQQAWLDSFRDVGLEPDRRFIFNSGDTVNEALELISEMYVSYSENWPTAFFCTNDDLAVGLIKAHLRLGLKIPDDVSVVGFDDGLPATVIEPELTTVHVPHRRLGKLAVEQILSLRSKQHVEPGRLILPTELVVRQSTAPFRNPGDKA